MRSVQGDSVDLLKKLLKNTFCSVVLFEEVVEEHILCKDEMPLQDSLRVLKHF